jgi:hypothetical protein
MLSVQVLELLQAMRVASHNNEEDAWSFLQAASILYLYASPLKVTSGQTCGKRLGLGYPKAHSRVARHLHVTPSSLRPTSRWD